MERSFNESCQEVDSEMLEKPMERFPYSPRLESGVIRSQYEMDRLEILASKSGVLPGQESGVIRSQYEMDCLEILASKSGVLPGQESGVLPGQYPSLDYLACLAVESGVLPGQYPNLDPKILNLKSGKEHQWIDYQWEGFQDRFHQKYRGPKFMVEFFCNRQASTAEFISSYAVERGALRGEYPFLDSEIFKGAIRGQYLVWDSKILKKISEGALPGQYQILDSKNFDGDLLGQYLILDSKNFEGDLLGQYHILDSKNFNGAFRGLYQILDSKYFGGALQGVSSGPLKEAKGLTKKKNYSGAKGDGSECQDAEGEGSKSGTSQDQDGGGVGSSSGESQGPDRGEGSASGENQGRDGNSEGNGSGDGGDEHQRGHDIEQGRQENILEEIDFPRINETIMAIIGMTTIAAVDFHYNGFIPTMILGLLIAINVFGFLCCMTSMLHRHRNPRAARNFGTIGAAAGGFGFLLLVSGPFSGYYPWVLLILGSFAILVIFVLAFMS